MKIETSDISTHPMTNLEQDITKAEKFIHATIIDELPQMINILRG